MFRVLEAEAAEREKRYSMQSGCHRDSYPPMENIEEHPTTPLSPFRLSAVPSPKVRDEIKNDHMIIFEFNTGTRTLFEYYVII